MAFCSNCGTELTEGAKFCPNCGNPSESSQAKKEIVSESSSDCSIVLVSAGAATLNVTKALREILGVGLKEAKDIIDSAPCTIMEGLTMSDAKGNAQYLRECGAITAIKQNGKTIQEDTPPHFNTSTQENTIIENDNSEEGLSIWEKIALGVAGFAAFTGIFGGASDGMWIAVLLSLCAMGAICAVFMGTIEKKYAWTTAIVSFLVVCSAIGASTDDKEEEQKQSANQTEQKEEDSYEKQKYRSEKGQCIDYARVVGQSAAEEGANDLIRQGYSKSDLKGIAGQQARLKYKTINDCCRPEFFKQEYPDIFTTSEQEKFRQQCIEAYVIGYMSALGN